jgi:hypothetical protein
MGKYGEMLGIWNITIGGADLKVKPRKGDNLELINILNKNKNDETKYMNDIYSFLVKLIERDVPPATDIEREELHQYVEFNLMELFKEMMIKFKWATPEQASQVFGGQKKD